MTHTWKDKTPASAINACPAVLGFDKEEFGRPREYALGPPAPLPLEVIEVTDERHS